MLPAREDFDSVGSGLLGVIGPRPWRRATATRRKEMALELCQWLAALWEVGSVGLTVADFDGAGEYDPNTNELFFNVALLHHDDCTEALSTIVHELRHAVQERVMRDPSLHPLGELAADEVARWRAAKAAYEQDAADLIAYAYNALESDAYGMELGIIAAYWKASYLRFGRSRWTVG